MGKLYRMWRGALAGQPPSSALTAHPEPTTSYAEAMARVVALQHVDGPEVNAVCGTRCLVHGARTPRAIVLVHGYTSCPAQWAQFAPVLFAAGDNVLIPRLPYHGLHDRMTTALHELTASELVRLMDMAIDCAAGLGDEVTVVGLSTGGVLAAWAAQFRPEVEHAVLISPSLSAGGIPSPLTGAATALLHRLPSQSWWWDRRRKHDAVPAHAYPRFSTRPLGQIFWLGDAVLRAARREPPVARSVTIVLNHADRAISLPLVAALLAAWQAHDLPRVTSYSFPAALNLPHDLIDPAEANAQVDLVYPIVVELIDQTHIPRSDRGMQLSQAGTQDQKSSR